MHHLTHPDTFMRRLSLFVAALCLAFTWHAHALSISIDANLLKDANGNAMPTTGLVILVASTNDATFNAPTPLNFVSGDDVIIAKWDLSAFGTPGVLSQFINTTLPVTAANPLMLYWYPTLNINSTAPGQNTPYGQYTDPVGVDGSAPWFGDSPSATISLKFLTSDANTDFDQAGTNAPSVGNASNITPTPIVINSQPANTTQNLGGTANFSVDASGTSLVYQWLKNGVNLTDGGNVSGSTTANLTLSNVSASDAASYSVFITNSQAVVTSSSATLTVVDPYISSEPASTTVAAAGTATFTVTASGSSTLTYQWTKAGSDLTDGTQGSGSVISGATTSTVTISGVQQADAANYAVLVSGIGGTITSSAATLSVTDTAPVFATPAADSTTTLDAGTTIVLTAAATGTTPITYQWKKGVSNLSDGAVPNGAVVSGAATGSLTLSGVMASDAGDYVCDAHNTVGDSLSHVTTIFVNDPVIVEQPVSFTASCGDVWPCLSVTAAGSTNLTYQWYTPDPSGTAIPDATNATLCFTDRSFASAGNYSVVVSNGFGNSITSSVATVTVVDTTAPVITLNGDSPQTVCQGSPYTEANATATDACDGPVSVTTSGNVDANTVGAYTITYTANDSHGNANTTYRVVNVQNCVASDPAITTQPLAQIVINGKKNVQLTIAASGTGTIRYQWFKEGTGAILHKTNYSLVFPTIGVANSGTYYCVVTGLTTVESSHVGLKVDFAPTASITPPLQTKTAGMTAQFKVTAGPVNAVDPSKNLGGPVTFHWLKNGSPLSGGANISIVTNMNTSMLTIMDVQSPDAATYQCVVSNEAAYVITANTKGILNVNPDTKNPVAMILHPSPNLRFTNGLAPYVGSGVTQTANLAPDLDIDGRATDNAFVTNVALVRIVPPDSLSNNVTLTYRTNAAGLMLPNSAVWTNHVTLVPGTNTFVAVASDTFGITNLNKSARTYYYFTNGTVVINVNPSAFGTIAGTPTLGVKPIQGANQLPIDMGFKVTARPALKKQFVNWTDANNNVIGSTTMLTFVATNGTVINANFK